MTHTNNDYNEPKLRRTTQSIVVRSIDRLNNHVGWAEQLAIIAVSTVRTVQIELSRMESDRFATATWLCGKQHTANGGQWWAAPVW